MQLIVPFDLQMLQRLQHYFKTIEFHKVKR